MAETMAESMVVEGPESEGDEIVVILSDQALKALQEIAAFRKITLEEAIRKAIANEHVISEEVANGATILVKRGRQRARELVS